MKKNSLNILGAIWVIACVVTGCSKSGTPDNSGGNGGTTPANQTNPAYPSAPNNPNNYPTYLTADCSQTLGDVMRIEQANVHSTTSALPGEKSRTWLQGFNHTTIRTWLALSTIVKSGNNYKYDGGPTVEQSLTYYSTCADSLLVALTAYNSTSVTMPAHGAGMQNLIQSTIVYYKTKFPKIKYIEAGNEPDYLGEDVASYYDYYKDYYKAVNAANAQLGLTGNNRIMLSNAPFTSSTTSSSGIVTYTFASPFLALYAADTDPGKRLDFFSIHAYMGQDDPNTCQTTTPQVLSTMRSLGLPTVPVFVTEYGMVGGEFIPSVWSEANIMTAWAPAQMAKAFYLYEGGASRVFNWCISHGTILHKSELGDLDNAYPNPYGNALLLCKEVSARGTRIKTVTSKISSKGLGMNALAAMGNGKGVAMLVWNYNYTNAVADQNVNVQISNIPAAAFTSGKMTVKVYLIDSGNNNFFNNSTQTTLKTTSSADYAYASSLAVPLKLEANSVVLITVTP